MTLRKTILTQDFHGKYADDADPREILEDSDEIEWLPFLIAHPNIAFKLDRVVDYFHNIDEVFCDHEGLHKDWVPSPLVSFENSEDRFADWQESCNVLISGLAGSGSRVMIDNKIRAFEDEAREFDESVGPELEDAIRLLDGPIKDFETILERIQVRNDFLNGCLAKMFRLMALRDQNASSGGMTPLERML